MARSIYSFWSDDWSMTRIYLKEGEANEENIAAVRGKLRTLLPEIPGVKVEVQENGQFWRQDRGKRIALQLVGEDSEVLASLAEDARARIEGIPGLVDPFSGSEQRQQEIHVELDREMASRMGVSAMQPAEVVGLTYPRPALAALPHRPTASARCASPSTRRKTKPSRSCAIFRSGPCEGQEDPARVAGDLRREARRAVDQPRQPADQRVGGRALRRGNARGLHAARDRRDERHRLPVRLLVDLRPLGRAPEGKRAGVPDQSRAGADADLRRDGVLVRVGATGAGRSCSSLPFALAGAFWTLYADRDRLRPAGRGRACCS